MAWIVRAACSGMALSQASFFQVKASARSGRVFGDCP